MNYSMDLTVNDQPVRRRKAAASPQKAIRPSPASGVAIEIKSYEELVNVINQRVAELQLSLSTIDDLAGLQDNYLSKCLRKKPVKRLGSVSGFSTFGALGLRLFFLQNDEATARTVARRVPRNDKHIRRRDDPKPTAKGI